MPDIAIDPSVLEERSDSYTSLTDLNDVPVFMSDYEKAVKEYQDTAQNNYQNIRKELFQSSVINDLDSNMQVKTKLFMETDTIIVKEAGPIEDNMLPLVIPAMGIVFVVVVVLLMRYIDKRRRKMREDETDDYVY